MEARLSIQAWTAIITIVTLIIIPLMVYTKVLAIRYAILPMLVMAQRVIFYTYILMQKPPPSETLTKVSAIISLEYSAAFLMVIIMYWYVHLKARKHAD